MSNADFDTLHMTPRPGPAAHPSPAEPLKTPARGHPYASNPGRIATSKRSPTRQPPGPTSPKPQYLQAIHRQLSPPRGSLQKSHTPDRLIGSGASQDLDGSKHESDSLLGTARTARIGHRQSRATPTSDARACTNAGLSPCGALHLLIAKLETLGADPKPPAACLVWPSDRRRSGGPSQLWSEVRAVARRASFAVVLVTGGRHLAGVAGPIRGRQPAWAVPRRARRRL